MDSAGAQSFEFAGFRLDRGSRLLRDSAGEPVEISAKAFDALVYFLEHPRRLVERAELMAAVWPNTIVEENTLSRIIVLLRRALGEELIVTVKGRGYQFVADVRAISDAAADALEHVAAPARPEARVAGRGARVAGLVFAALVATGLGFVIVDQYLLGEDAARGDSPAPPEFDPILRYAEPPTHNERALDFYRSAREYEWYGKSTSTLASATQLYESAVEEDPEFALAWARLSIAHIEQYFFGLDPTEARRALSLEAAERARELQPDLAEAHMAFGWYNFHVREYETAIEVLEIARELGARDAELNWRIGMVFRDMGRWVQALTAFERAVEIDPKDVELRLSPAEAYVMLRDYDRAERYIDRTLELKPDLVQALNAKALIPLLRDGEVAAAKQAAARSAYPNAGSLWFVPPQYFGWHAALYERDYDAALAVLDPWDDDAWRAFLQYVPKAAAYAAAHELAGRADRARGYFEQARAQVEAALAGGPERPDLLIALGEALAGVGEVEAANAAARRAIENAERGGDHVTAPFPRLDAVLRVFVRTGDFDAALAELETYLSEPGIWSIEGLLPDPRLDPLRDDARFQALVAEHRRADP
jgi:DNA-binding winged helix-turn-helix (wHTH) protein/tetratricopeptide (TPR) repeat protein